MKKIPTRSLRLVYLVLLAMVAPATWCQNNERTAFAIMGGIVSDAQNRPLADAAVSLESDDHARKFTTRSDPLGHYRFEAVPAGSYTLRASKAGFLDRNEGPFAVRQGELKSMVLYLTVESAAAPAKDALSAAEFTDEPQFNVAGVTDPSNLGGHGSDVVLRTKEALAKETASLNHEATSQPTKNPSGPEELAETHARLAEMAEREGRPLEAVQEYQRAAELQPNEPHLFAWGAELLLHRAFEPAIEVFAKGHRLYPDSVRMLVGLSVAIYDQGKTGEGEKLLLEACDLNPSDATPYLFLGRLQETEKIEPAGWTERLQRFASLHPEDSQAHYYYAVALSKQSGESGDLTTVESELKKAIALDPHFGIAYLQLGILDSERKDFSAAIYAFKKAIETSPLPDEAHYRLAQVYRQLGETEKAREETVLYNQTSQQKAKEAEQKRHEIQQFIYTLRGQKEASPAPASKPE